MNDTALFDAVVPVARHYARRIEGLLAGLDTAGIVALENRLAPDGFDAGTHLQIALGFALRTALPLAKRDVPEGPEWTGGSGPLRDWAAIVIETLDALDPDAFTGATARPITHRAGEADLTQDAATFATLYGLPNMLFHFATAHAILRAAGVPVGKGDFDGFHAYPHGFSFVSSTP